MNQTKQRLAAFLLSFAVSAAALAQVTFVLAGAGLVPAPIVTPNGGEFGGQVNVTVTESLAGAQIVITLNGHAPVASDPTAIICTSPCALTIATSSPLRSVGTKLGYAGGIETDANFQIDISPTGAPFFTPPPGLFTTTPTIAVGDLTPLAAIACTQDGSTPTTGSPAYLAPFTYPNPGVYPLNCIAKAPGFLASAPVFGTFTFQPPALVPVILTAPGQYTSQALIQISSACLNSTIYYTLDGNLPTVTSQVYTAAFFITKLGQTTLTTMDTCPLHSQSTNVTALFTIVAPGPAPIPTFVPASQNATAPFSVIIKDTAAGAIATFTLDGSQPNPNNGTNCTTPCTVPITLNGKTVLNALVNASGLATSPVATATYIINAGVLGACPATSGPLTFTVTNPRVVGISPLLVFFDAHTTADAAIPANTTTFQDVFYTWNFGDGGISGSGTWAGGANPNKNSLNTATGGVAAHLYEVTRGAGDGTFQPVATATDGTNRVSCQPPPITVYDPDGANGYPATATTCVNAQAPAPAAGKNGCPVGARPLVTSSFVTALATTHFGSNERVLFHCGDTFTGNNATLNAHGFTVGSYGSCENSQSGRPTFSLGTGGGVIFSGADFDGRFMDIDFEGSGYTASSATPSTGSAMDASGSGLTYPYEMTTYNVLVNGVFQNYYSFGGHENALVDFVANGMGSTVGTFLNNSENQCLNGSVVFNCGLGGSSYVEANYASVKYQAILGSSFNGLGAKPTAFFETFRMSACRLCVFMDDTFENGAGGGAAFKFHNGQSGTVSQWLGQPDEYIEISDTLYTGFSGSQLAEISPQNGVTDERLQNIVFERNLTLGTPSVSFTGTISGGTTLTTSNVTSGTIVPDQLLSGAGLASGTYIVSGSGNSWIITPSQANRGPEVMTIGTSVKLMFDVMNGTIRNNVCNSAATSGSGPCYEFVRRGCDWQSFTNTPACTTGSSGAPVNASAPQFDELYNNSCYGNVCAAFSPIGGVASGNNGWAQNNFMFNPSGGGSTVGNSGSGNQVDHNSSPVTANPGFTNQSGTFTALGDYAPTTNVSGATTPATFNPYDAAGVAWSPLWNLGALHPYLSTVFFQQPTLSGAVGNFYINVPSTTLATRGWGIQTVEAPQCSSTPTDPSGAYTTSFNPSALTGLSTSTGNLSYQSGTGTCASQTGASVVQATGTSVGAYNTGADLPQLNPASKFGTFGGEWFPAPQVKPFATWNGIEVSWWGQVPTATANNGAGYIAGNTSNSYSSMDLLFTDQNGNKVVWSISYFFLGEPAASTSERPTADVLGGSSSLEIKTQIQVGIQGLYGGSYITVMPDSSIFQNAVWNTDKFFHVTISKAQFQQGLNDILAHGAPNPPPLPFSTTPSDYSLVQTHYNAELHYATAPATLGWYGRDLQIKFFQ